MAVGFTPADDPAANGTTAGYRSHVVARKHATEDNQFLRGSDVSYNGFVFPPQIKAKATVVQEYTKDQRSVKYLTIALTIEAVITPFDLYEGTDGTLGQLQAIPGTDIPGVTNDESMQQIRERLSQPCQILSFNLQGFGKLMVQGHPEHVPRTSANDFVYDVDYGPRPQVLDWEPIAGALACRIQWLVVTRIPACGRNLNQSGLGGILDFTYDMVWSIDEAGFFARTVTGSLELARTRLPNANDIHANKDVPLTLDKALFDRANKALTDIFPILGGFRRSETFKLESNKKFLTFSFTDTEIPSPTPIPSGILDIQMSESVSSALGEGQGSFAYWNWVLSGSISVYHSKSPGQDIVLNKRLAFASVYLILLDRLKRARSVTRRTKSSRGTTQIVRAASYIPKSISISNDIFGTGINFSFGYRLICNGGSLFAATGMFDAVRQANFTWDVWRNHYSETGTRLLYPNVIPNMDGVVDLCHPINITPSSQQSPRRNPASFVTSPGDDVDTNAPEESYSWIAHKNSFQVDTTYNTSAVSLLSPEAKEAYPVLDGNPSVTSKLSVVPPPAPSSGSPSSGGGGNGSGTPGSYLVPDMQTAAHPTTIITMIGGADRIGYPINAPELKSVGGMAVVKYGTDRIIPSEMPSGFTRNGQMVSIHRCLWKKSYILTGYPAPSQDQWYMESDGHPQEFV